MSTIPNLSLMKDGALLKTIPVEGEMVLGRAEECGIRLNDRAISRQHLIFKKLGDSVSVEKKSEFAPLLVNGMEVTQALLKVGDMVTVGPYLIRYEGAPIPPAQAMLTPAASPGQNDSAAGAEAAPPESGAEAEATPPGLGGEAGIDGVVGAVPEGENPAIPGMPSGIAMETLNPEGASSGEAGATPEISTENPSVVSPEISSEVSNEPIDEDGKTKITTGEKVSVHLIFKKGTANVEDYELTKDVVYVGRGKDCEIILNDKKASRKNSMIRKSGLNYIIKDLNSSNGTFVNGAKVQEQELSGDDVIKVGNVEFTFRAMSTDYLSVEKNLQSLPEELLQEAPVADLGFGAPPEGLPGAVSGIELGAGQPAAAVDPLASAGAAAAGMGGTPGVTGEIPGITGMGAASTGKKKTLIERFRALPKRTQMIGVVAAIMLFWWLSEDENSPVQIKKKKPVAAQKKGATAASGAVEKGPMTFDMLTPEKKAFVETEHNLAFEHYKNREYDQALFELQKIFSMINDYKDSREIERYAKEGKRALEAIEEEKKKKEEEAILKAKIAQLVEECRQRMEKKQYEQAREYFIQILGLDPDSKAVDAWRKEIETYEESLKLQGQQKQVEEEINKQGWNLFNEGSHLMKAKHYHEAMAVFQKSIDIGVSDKKLAPASKEKIALCKKAIAKMRDPVLRAAKEAEEAGEFSKAYHLYQKAIKLDPPYPAGYAGINRIKKILHDQAKVAYTEAILAESYSDFDVAKKMFQECLNVAPVDDEYHDRALRKLSRYFKKKDDVNGKAN